MTECEQCGRDTDVDENGLCIVCKDYQDERGRLEHRGWLMLVGFLALLLLGFGIIQGVGIL